MVEPEITDPCIHLQGQVKKHYILTLLFFFILSTLLIGGYQSVRRRLVINQYEANSRVEVEYLEGLIISHFRSLLSDMNFLPELNEMLRYMELPNYEDRAYIEREFHEFSLSRKIYDQIRFIDVDGMELIRVNYKEGRSEITDSSELQNKGDRYYFKETNVLGAGDLYLSPLDLNIERGLVEIPLKPMIRIGSPVFDRAGNRKGIVVLNYLAENFLEDLKEFTRNQPGLFGLLNDDGYWIYADNPDLEWRFMYPETLSDSLSLMNPGLWQDLEQHCNKDPFVSSGYLYSCRDLNPLEGEKGDNRNLHWYLVNRISLNEMGVHWSRLIFYTLFFSAILTALAAFPLWLILKTNIQRNQYWNELKHSARYDSLTLLPNRAFLMERIQELLKEQYRYNFTFGLLFIDLDGFKAVNDTYGHGGGDILLKTVARRMTDCVRDSDLVARIGGDEFIVILSRIDELDQCQIVAQKILDSLKREVSLAGKKTSVGASIGITMATPGAGWDVSDLISQADDAMYKVKTSGKGHFQVF